MFRFKKSVPVSYDKQGLVYFYSKLYNELPVRKKEQIRALCREVGGDYEKALLEFVTTNIGANMVCAKHFLSRSTLERLVRRYYDAFWDSWWME